MSILFGEEVFSDAERAFSSLKKPKPEIDLFGALDGLPGYKEQFEEFKAAKKKARSIKTDDKLEKEFIVGMMLDLYPEEVRGGNKSGDTKKYVKKWMDGEKAFADSSDDAKADTLTRSMRFSSAVDLLSGLQKKLKCFSGDLSPDRAYYPTLSTFLFRLGFLLETSLYVRNLWDAALVATVMYERPGGDFKELYKELCSGWKNGFVERTDNGYKFEGWDTGTIPLEQKFNMLITNGKSGFRGSGKIISWQEMIKILKNIVHDNWYVFENEGLRVGGLVDEERHDGMHTAKTEMLIYLLKGMGVGGDKGELYSLDIAKYLPSSHKNSALYRAIVCSFADKNDNEEILNELRALRTKFIIARVEKELEKNDGSRDMRGILSDIDDVLLYNGLRPIYSLGDAATVAPFDWYIGFALGKPDRTATHDGQPEME